MTTDPISTQKFVIYTNPNNVTDKCYLTIGTRDINDLMKSARQYPGSYEILYTGKGLDNFNKVKSCYNLVNI